MSLLLLLFEVTELSRLEEYLELPPAAWNIDYREELEKCQESDEYLPIPQAARGAMKSAGTGQTAASSAAQGELAGLSSSGSEPSSPICELPRTPLTVLPRVENSPTAVREVTVVPNSDLGVSASSSTRSMDTVTDTPQQAAPAQVRPVARQAEQPSTSNPDSPFERDEIRAAQTADDGLSVVIAIARVEIGQVRMKSEPFQKRPETSYCSGTLCNCRMTFCIESTTTWTGLRSIYS